MYSKEFEEFINLTLEDGVISAEEREVLYIRGEKEGLMRKEIDIIVEGKLKKFQREMAENSPLAKFRRAIEKINDDCNAEIAQLNEMSSQSLQNSLSNNANDGFVKIF